MTSILQNDLGINKLQLLTDLFKEVWVLLSMKQNLQNCLVLLPTLLLPKL